MPYLRKADSSSEIGAPAANVITSSSEVKSKIGMLRPGLPAVKTFRSEQFFTHVALRIGIASAFKRIPTAFEPVLDQVDFADALSKPGPCRALQNKVVQTIMTLPGVLIASSQS
jgi:hypothetical protein